MRCSHSFLVILGFATGVAGCGYAPTEDPITKTIIQDYSQWNTSGLWGEVTSPQYPVPISSTMQSIGYTGVFTGPSINSTPRYVTGALEAKFFGFGGPWNPSDTWANWLDYSAYPTWNWANHPTDIYKMRVNASGNYPAGYDGASDRRDRVFSKARMYHTSSGYYDAIGHAWLPWRYTSESGLMIGSATEALKDAPVWFQASADLPTPITYSWDVNGTPESGWTSSFVTTSFSTTGAKTLSVTMTGANSAQVQKSWLIGIICPGGGIFC